MENFLIVMVGLPGSGKSTKAKELSELHNAKILSSDGIRKELWGDESVQGDPTKVFKKLYDSMREELSAGRNVIIDATNTTLKNRANIFREIPSDIRKKIFVVAWVITTPIEKCIEQDSKRDRVVGKDVIYKFLNGYQLPQKFEGFDTVIFNDIAVRPEFNLKNATDELTNMVRFNQNNPHHLYSLFEHCSRLAHCYERSDRVHRAAGYFHDVGKQFTKTTDEKGVSHYYNHDNVGTYYLLNHLDYFDVYSFEEALKVLFLINYHMKAHNDFKGYKAEAKYRKMFGDSLYEELIQFGEYDKIASGTDIVNGEIVKR